jgi:hypothetical protein
MSITLKLIGIQIDTKETKRLTNLSTRCSAPVATFTNVGVFNFSNGQRSESTTRLEIKSSVAPLSNKATKECVSICTGIPNSLGFKTNKHSGGFFELSTHTERSDESVHSLLTSTGVPMFSPGRINSSPGNSEFVTNSQHLAFGKLFCNKL